MPKKSDSSSELRMNAEINVYFTPGASPAVRADPDQLRVPHGKVANIIWKRAGANANSWTFTFIGFKEPVGTGCPIRAPRLSGDRREVTTEDFNDGSCGRPTEDKVYSYLIFVEDRSGVVHSSDPAIVNSRDPGTGPG